MRPSSRGRAYAALLLLPLLLAACGRDQSPIVEPVGQAVDPLTWELRQELEAGQAQDAGINTFVGGTVSMSGDAIFVGAPEHGVFIQGAVYVFALEGGLWAPQPELEPVDATNGSLFGASVSLSGDTAIVGAPGAQAGHGAAYVFARSGGLWSQQQELTPWDGLPGSVAGTAVAVDGDTAVVGAPNNMSNQPGTVYLFTRTGTVWTEQQQLTAADAAPGDLPGAAVAVSGDTVVVGAPGHADGQGAAYVYVVSNGAAILQQELAGFGSMPGERFGTSVALSGDTAIIGAPQHDLGQAGLTYVFTRTGSTWSLPVALAPGSPPPGFGNSVALSGDVALVGAIDQMMGLSGVAYAFTRTGSLWSTQQLLSGDSVPDPGFGNSVAVNGSIGVVVGRTHAYVFGVGSSNGDACTSATACASGWCTDGVCCDVAVCLPPNDCQTATSCQAGTGTCQGTAKPDGLACDDHDVCTHPDQCAGGVCVGHAPTTCPPIDECHEFGACDPLSGECSTPAKSDGLPCTGGVCTGGVCGPARAGASSSSSSSSGGAAPMTSPGGCGCDVVGGPPGCAPAVMAGLLFMARRRRGGAKTATRARGCAGA